MRHIPWFFSLLVSIVCFCSAGVKAGTVWLLAPSPSVSPNSIHSRFLSELGLVLAQDALFLRTDGAEGFFSLPMDEQVRAAGALCQGEEDLSIVWLQPGAGGVRGVGLVVATGNGMLGRAIGFEAPVKVLAEVAIIAGELIAHGRAFAEAKTPTADGWIVVSGGGAGATGDATPGKTTRAGAVLDTEKPWDRPEERPAAASRSVLAIGGSYLFSGSVVGGLGPWLSLGGQVSGTARLLDWLAVSLVFGLHGGAFPDTEQLTVRALRMSPAAAVAFTLDLGAVGVRFEILGGVFQTRLRIERSEQPTAWSQWWSGMARFDIMIVLAQAGPIALLLGPSMTVELQRRRFVGVVAEEMESLFSTAVLSFGGRLGVAFFL